MTDENSWRTPTFRQSVVAKIEEAIRQSGMSTSRNSIEMENHVFQKAKSKEEYLGFVARLILHVREMKPKQGGGMPVAGQGQGGPGMPDPINALQNLASQGTRNSMMNMGPQAPQMGGPQQAPATNLLQTLNSRPNQQMMMGGMPGTMPMQDRQNINMPPNGNQMAAQQMGNQMANQIRLQQIQQSNTMNPMSNHLGAPLQNTVSNQMAGQMQMAGSMANQIQSQMMGNMPQLSQQKSQGMIINQMNANFPRQPTPNQMFSQSPSPSVQSPVGLGNQPPVASPALAASPGAQMNMIGSAGPTRSVGMAPSPGSSLNTPGQMTQSPMTGGNMTDDHVYREKVKQLSKYIEPLRKMIVKLGNDESEKLGKMKKLLEILSNPQQRMPLDTLIKCEIVLEKIDFKRADSSVPSATTQLPFKEPHVFHALLDAVSSNIQSPVFNHTCHRTFGPTLDSLFGPEIKLVPPLKKAKIEEPTSDIPDVLQGEIARLDQKFKVSLDTSQQPGSKSIQLNCWLDDKHLPCVPPIIVVIPEDYPNTSPTCQVSKNEYDATEFLAAVRRALLNRITKLPKHFSVSQLLDTWEMSVRQACSPKQIEASNLSVMMGL